MVIIKRAKHVVVPYVENTLYYNNIHSCVRPVHTLTYLLTYFLTYLVTYFLTYLLHGADSFLRS